MKLLKSVIAAIGLALLVGCATTNTPIDPTTLVADACGIAKDTVKPIIDRSVQYAEKNPAKRQEILADINLVAVNVQGLLTKGNFNPAALADAFKVRDPYVNLIMLTVPILYDGWYTQLSRVNALSNAVEIVTCIASDAADATNPTNLVVQSRIGQLRFAKPHTP